MKWTIIRHMNEKTLFISWQRSTNKEVNDCNLDVSKNIRHMLIWWILYHPHISFFLAQNNWSNDQNLKLFNFSAKNQFSRKFSWKWFHGNPYIVSFSNFFSILVIWSNILSSALVKCKSNENKMPKYILGIIFVERFLLFQLSLCKFEIRWKCDSV